LQFHLWISAVITSSLCNQWSLQPHHAGPRVEGAIGCSKQHNRIALVCANMLIRFWQDAIVDITTCKKNTLWAKRDELSTANDHMQPALAGSYKTVDIPSGSRVTGYLLREHPLVNHGSFKDGFF